jgi:hypothetical protein
LQDLGPDEVEEVVRQFQLASSASDAS